MSEREKLEQAIAAQEALRATLGDAVVDMTVAALREKLAALEPAAAAGQRKLVTILFADVSGFTAMSETMDAEEVRDTMNSLWEKLDAAVLRHGGRVDKHIGDALMALFGSAAAREDDPERAVRAALALQEELRAFAASTGRDLRMRVGVNTGTALLGAVGSNAEFTAMGDAVNLASRLEHAAPVGGILISHDLYLHVRGVFDVEPQEPLQVKGKKDPVKTYVVKRAKPRSFRIGTRGLDIETRMVGRDAELKALQDGMEDAFEEREPAMRTVTGEAGVGKSRLLYEFTQWFELHPRRFWYLAGRASPGTADAPYGLLKDVFAQRFQIGDDDSVQAVREKFERGAAELLAGDKSSEATAHLVGRLLGFDFSNSAHAAALASNPALARQRGEEGIAALLRGAAAADPVLLLLEDIHWADDASLDVVSGLMSREKALPLFVLALTRPSLYERRPSWGEGLAGHRRIDLAPLSKRDSRRLVDDLLSRVEAIPDSLRDMVVNGSEGNPFYVEELIRMLMEDGIIDRGGDTWRVDAQRLASARVPPTLVGVLQARLDSLGPSEKEALQCASVVGRIFWDSSLRRLAPEAAAGDGVLDALRGKDMVFRREGSAFADAREYIFKHALLRDVAYESVLKKQRKAYHKLAAEWLIAQSGARAAEFAASVARHYELAELGEEAASFLELSARKSALIGAFDEAAESLRRALELLPAAALARRCAALHALAKTHMDASRFDESLRRHVEALALARELGQPVPLAQVLNGLSALVRRLGRYDEARERGQEALALARGAGARAEAAESLFQLGTVAYNASDYEGGRAQLEESLAMRRELGDALGMARCLNNLGILFIRLGLFDEAGARYKEAHERYLEAGDKAGASLVTGNLGEVQARLGRAAQARALFEEALRFQREHGMSLSVANNVDSLAELDLKEGRLEEARRGFEQALRITIGLGVAPATLNSLAGLAMLGAQRTDTASALELAALVLTHPAAKDDARRRAAAALRLLGLAEDAPELAAARAAAAGTDPLAVARRLVPPAA